MDGDIICLQRFVVQSYSDRVKPLLTDSSFMRHLYVMDSSLGPKETRIHFMSTSR